VFYCHFPDLLLSSSRGNSLDGGKEVKWSLGKSILSLYRLPVDYLEEATTGEADKILVNSMFTSDVFEKTFAGMGRAPRVVYPAVDVHTYGKTMVAKKEDAWLIR
jgi:alpha-1,3/alpha-1,6-mannosyltransferase